MTFCQALEPGPGREPRRRLEKVSLWVWVTCAASQKAAFSLLTHLSQELGEDRTGLFLQYANLAGNANDLARIREP